MKFWAWCPLVQQKQAIRESFPHKNLSFFPRTFSAMRYANFYLTHTFCARNSIFNNAHAWRGGASRTCIVQRSSACLAGIRPRRWPSATESRSSISSPGNFSSCCSWHPIVTPCAFQHTLVATCCQSPGWYWMLGDIGCWESRCNGGEGSGSDQCPTVWRTNGNCTTSECHCWCDTKKVCALCCCKQKYKCKLPMLVLWNVLATVLTKTGIILKVF